MAWYDDTFEGLAWRVGVLGARQRACASEMRAHAGHAERRLDDHEAAIEAARSCARHALAIALVALATALMAAVCR